jgi:lauroyl/myristoyl acyltransferase
MSVGRVQEAETSAGEVARAAAATAPAPPAAVAPAGAAGREGGPAAWSSAHAFSDLWWRRAALWGFRNVPESLLGAAVPAVASAVAAFLPDVRAAVAANLARVMGPAGALRTQWRVHRVFQSFADVLATAYIMYAVGRNRVRQQVHQGVHYIEEALRLGRGAIVGTAHLGSWHVGSHALERFGVPVNVVMAHEPDSRVQSMIEGMRDQKLNVIYSTGSVFSSLAARTALQRGEIVAMQVDRLMGNGAMEIDFFGQPARFPTGPVVLARTTGAPIIPAFAVRLPDGAHLFAAEAPVVVRTTRDRESDVREALERVAGHLEAWIRRYPYQWFNFYPFWGQGTAR